MLVLPASTGLAYGAPAPAASTVAAAPVGSVGSGDGSVRGPSPSPSAAFPELGASVAAELDDAVRKVLDETSVPGVTVGLWAPGKGSYVRSFGVADKATGAPMDSGLYTRIGSLTKTFTVTALLELVDEGKVGLDDPIGQYVSGVPNGDTITLRRLAGMRSGLFNYSEDPDFFKALTSDPERPFTPRELLGYSFKHPVLFPPGERFDYSNTNLILLGLVVEKAGGAPLGRSVQDKVLDPAGLDRTLFPVGAEFPSPHAHGYTDQTASGKVEDATDWNPSWGWAAGAMISDLEDLRSWARTLATGTLLTPETQAQRLDFADTGFPGTGYGLGVFTSNGWIGHNGSLPGYETVAVYLPEAQATMVIVLNTDIVHDGAEPSTLFATAVTEIVSPDHVYVLPSGAAQEQRNSTASPSPSSSSPSAPVSPVSPGTTPP
ncbi:beta-lactamase family protein [Streptomyces qinzhouensis]|uniref:Beta-lactamase family protein n=2 Tax=Streptomyces qinzhouensis TaxID=2599401 RepID=A0A5B8JS93_9ACTN|nr:beta-lactamase family protein [Streptomyces qinzhouensis]